MYLAPRMILLGNIIICSPNACVSPYMTLVYLRVKDQADDLPALGESWIAEDEQEDNEEGVARAD